MHPCSHNSFSVFLAFLFLYSRSLNTCANVLRRMVATGSYDRIVRLWSSTTGVILREFDVFGSGHINALSFDSVRPILISI